MIDSQYRVVDNLLCEWARWVGEKNEDWLSLLFVFGTILNFIDLDYKQTKQQYKGPNKRKTTSFLHYPCAKQCWLIRYMSLLHQSLFYCCFFCLTIDKTQTGNKKFFSFFYSIIIHICCIISLFDSILINSILINNANFEYLRLPAFIWY